MPWNDHLSNIFDLNNTPKMEPYISSEVGDDGICTITFYHPKSNALPADLLNKLSETIGEAGMDDTTKVIVLRSEGEKAFCAGASFEELLQIRSEQEGLRFFSGFAGVINAIRSCGKLVIGAVQGKTVGGGVGLAAACDFTIAMSSAAVKLSELNIGIGPFVIEPAVSRKIGLSAFTEMTLQPEVFFDAHWAVTKGLFQRVTETYQELELLTTQKAVQLAALNPEALSELKKMLWQGTDHWDQLLAERAAISGKLVLSDFTRKALAAYQ